MPKDHQAPKETAGDRAYGLVRGAVGSIPMVGAAAAELLQLVLAPPIARRQAEWMNDVAEALRRLESERGVKLEGVSENPTFIDAVMSATQIAIRTSQAGKQRALRSAVLNSALASAPDVTLQQMFLAFTDRFTDAHLAILGLFHDPQAWRDAKGRSVHGRQTGDAANILEDAFPPMKSRPTLYEQLWSDLYSAGLVNIATLHNKGEGNAVMKKRTTEMGDAFLAFITSPVTEGTGQGVR